MDQLVRPTCTLDARLSRAARALLDWGLIEAGRKAGLSVAGVLAVEGKGTRSATAATVDRLRRAYEEAGVDFFDDGPDGFGLRIAARLAAPPA